MASTDPLMLLRQSIASNKPPVLTIGESQDNITEALTTATHLTFTSSLSFPLTTPTRFISSDKPVDLRSIYFAWQHKDSPTEYIPAAQALNDALGENTIQNLVFVQRLDLITWLEGSSDESEYIKPLSGQDAATHSGAAAQTSTAAGTTTSGTTSRTAKSGNPTIQKIYNKERRIGDRNSVLRGVRPTDFSHVRKIAENYLKLSKERSKAGNSSANPNHPSNVSMASHPKPNAKKRADPIILLSPSASALLRMSNIKGFLEGGVFTVPDASVASGDTNMVQLTRLMPSIDKVKTQRFIIVDSTDQFKPEYWDRVVAVFTTGQLWQFRSYKWQTPPELFQNVLGIYVGQRGDELPATVKSWGRVVANLQIEPYLETKISRWKDREVVEGIWNRIEDHMKRKGWTTNGPPVRA